MAEPVTIGGQTFIRTADGWVDQKSKAKAPEGLLSLLNRLQVENSPEGKKKRVKIDTSRPVVKLGKTEYVWDLNSKVWIDKKTKDAANPAFSKLIEAAYQGIVQGTTEEEKLYESWAKKAAAGQVFTGMGVAGQAAKQKVKKPTGGGQFSVANVKINSPIIRMIEKLSVIDGYLKQRLANDMAIANSQSVSAKEQAIEQSAIQTDATPNLKEDNIDAEVEKTNKESQAILVAGAVAAGALFISQLDPVKETFNSIVGFAKGVYNFASDIVGVINEGLVRIVGTPESRGEQSSTTPGATPTANTERSAGAVQPASGAGEGAAFPGPGESSTSNGRASSGPATPEEITTPFPGPTSSSNTPSSSSPASPSSSTTPVRSDAKPVTPPAAGNKPGSPAAAKPESKPKDDRSWWERNAPSWAGGKPAPSPSATSAKPSPAPVTNDPFSAYTGSGGKLSNDPAIRNKAFFPETQTKKDSVDGYINPVEGHSINSAYGMRRHPVYGDMRFHTGVDIAANAGTPVRAVKSGTVTKISANQKPYSGFGNVVIIDHGDGYQTVYAHLSQFACKVGDSVQQGQVIGYIGSTGTSTGNHLHFIVQKTGHAMPTQGNTVNPATLLRKGGVTIPAGMEGYDMEGGGDGSTLQQVATAGVELTKGAMEAIGTILRAGLGPMTPTSGSQLSTVNDTMSGNIARAARERTATVAATKTPESVATTRSDPVNMNASTGSSTIQNMPTTSDKAGVEFYLTRMGFPKIIYTQTARGATLR
jgi:murein DD-endopeptidase MepM/ murein hydrolase activator NlpD